MTIENIQNHWDDWRRTGIIASDEILIEMMQDLINAKNVLEKINRQFYDLAIVALLHEWYSLDQIAFHREIPIQDRPRWTDSTF